MARNPSSRAAPPEERQATLNAAKWSRGEHVAQYASRQLRPVEAVLIGEHRGAVSGKVLELGCGAGRLTGHLIEVAREVHGIDLSPEMVAYCESVYPQATFSVADLQDLSQFESGAYDVVFAPFNVLDVLGHEARRDVLVEIRRLLAPEGLLIFSSHNRDYARHPAAKLRRSLRLWVGAPRSPLRSIRNLPRRLANRRRLRRLQREEDTYAILNDEAHDFSVLHYYVSPGVQAGELSDIGYRFIECRDLNGTALAEGETGASSSELHYVARR